MDKRNVYDWDTRIHLLARGPGIKKGVTFAEPVRAVTAATCVSAPYPPHALRTDLLAAI